ncbi:hypothetical protein D3C72_1253770 [compost metagenome]
MARGAAQVHQAALGQQDDLLAVREYHVVHLRLDLVPLVLFHRGDVDLVVEVTDVADDGLVLHLDHVVMRDDVVVAGAGDEDVAVLGGVVHGHHAVAFHRGLQRADRVDLGHPHLRRQRAQRLRAALAHVAVAGHDGDLAGDHHVGGALDAVHQRFAAAVQVVELALGDRVVDVDRRKTELALLRHLVQAVHAGGGFLGHAADGCQVAAVPARVLGQLFLDRGEQVGFFLAARVGDQRLVLLGARAQVQQQRGVAAVVQDHVRRATVGPVEDAVGEVPVFLQRFALEGEHGRTARGDGGGGVVLRREDVARGPAHVGAQCLQRLDQHGGLDRHVQRAGDACALERLRGGEFVADRHQAGHFGLGNGDFLAAPAGQVDVGDEVVLLQVGHSVHVSLPVKSGTQVTSTGNLAAVAWRKGTCKARG